MTVAEIVQWASDEFGERNLTTPQQALTYLNQVQQMAFDRDLDAFINMDNFVTVNPISPQGPYPMPTAPGVRKLIGITTYTLEQLSVIRQGGQLTVTDYGLPTSTVDERTVYTQINIQAFPPPVTFTFIQDPTGIITDANTYRFVYYVRPALIRALTDDENLWIPEEFHANLCVEGIKILADSSTLGTHTPKERMEPYLEPFWSSMTQSQDLGNRDNLFGQGQP